MELKKRRAGQIKKGKLGNKKVDQKTFSNL